MIRSPRRVALTAALVALGFGLAFAAPKSASADIYQYTDKDGVIHFTTTKPANPSAKLIARDEGVKRHASSSSSAAGMPRVAPSDRDPARYTRYDTWIREAAALYKLPVELVRAIIKVESDYDPKATSYAGARGLMQLMPKTAESMQVKDIGDPRENIFGGVRYLRILANTFNGDLVLTIAGYNAGEDAVIRHKGVPPFEQTKDYVTKVLHYYKRYRTLDDPTAASSAYVAPTPSGDTSVARP
jgi:soluble lytic murein transglycosylase-like protein